MFSDVATILRTGRFVSLADGDEREEYKDNSASLHHSAAISFEAPLIFDSNGPFSEKQK